jgi:hypothetical protein
MNQPELAAVLAVRARWRALAFSAERMVARYLALYRRLGAARRPASSTGEVRRCVS